MGYCFEAINELNLKTDCMRDIITAENFKRNDIITLQQTKKNIKWADCSRLVKHALTSNKSSVESYQIYWHNTNILSLYTKKESEHYTSFGFDNDYKQKKITFLVTSTNEFLEKTSNYLLKTETITRTSSCCGPYLY